MVPCAAALRAIFSGSYPGLLLTCCFACCHALPVSPGPSPTPVPPTCSSPPYNCPSGSMVNNDGIFYDVLNVATCCFVSGGGGSMLTR